MRSLNTPLDVLNNVHSAAGLGMHKSISDLTQDFLTFYSGDFKELKKVLDNDTIMMWEKMLLNNMLLLNELAAIDSQLKERILQNIGNNDISVFEQFNELSALEQLKGVN